MNENDHLYKDAVEIVKINGSTSTSFLQRKLRIGYFRAQNLMDMLEDNKIIERANGTKPQKILI